MKWLVAASRSSVSGFPQWRTVPSGRAFLICAPGADYEALYQSALCRQKADWLVGINATRLFSVLYHRTLNVGRVQTPTLAMMADRDAKITLFHKGIICCA